MCRLGRDDYVFLCESVRQTTPSIIHAVVGIYQYSKDLTAIYGERGADGVNKLIDAVYRVDSKLRQTALPADMLHDVLVILSFNEENPFGFYVRH